MYSSPLNRAHMLERRSQAQARRGAFDEAIESRLSAATVLEEATADPELSADVLEAMQVQVEQLRSGVEPLKRSKEVDAYLKCVRRAQLKELERRKKAAPSTTTPSHPPALSEPPSNPATEDPVHASLMHSVVLLQRLNLDVRYDAAADRRRSYDESGVFGIAETAGEVEEAMDEAWTQDLSPSPVYETNSLVGDQAGSEWSRLDPDRFIKTPKTEADVVEELRLRNDGLRQHIMGLLRELDATKRRNSVLEASLFELNVSRSEDDEDDDGRARPPSGSLHRMSHLRFDDSETG